jgi:hypothetical protein
VTTPLVPQTEDRQSRLRRRAAEDLQQLARDDALPELDSEQARRRRDRTTRWQAAREAEQIDESRDAETRGLRDAEIMDMWDRAATPSEPRDPFFHMESSDEPVAQRPLGPITRGGVRHNDPYRPGSHVNPTFEQMKDAFDPFQSESQLYRTLAQIRYKDPLLEPLVFRTGKTVAKGAFRLYDLLHAAAPAGSTVERWLGDLEQDMGTRIARDEARESVVRERYMTPLERSARDLANFAAEFELTGRLFPFLKARPFVRATPEGASFLTRELMSASRLARSGATQAAQFGTFEGARSLLAPKFLNIPAQDVGLEERLQIRKGLGENARQ